MDSGEELANRRSPLSQTRGYGPATSTPIWVVAGLLGAGKTSLLRRLARATARQRLAFVINEFAAVDMDAAAVERAGGLAFAVSGGSVFGRFRAAEFAGALERISGGVPLPGGDIVSPPGVVVEASGLSDPRCLASLLFEHGLGDRFHVAGVTALVDPWALTRPLLALPNIRGQVEAADLVLLNKTDLRDEREVESVRWKLKSIHPGVAVVRCVGAAIDPAIVLAESVQARGARLDEAFGACTEFRHEREWISFSRPVPPDQLAARLDELGDGLIGARGVVRTADGWTALAWQSGAWSAGRAEPQAESCLALVWDPSPTRAETLRRLRRDLGSPG